MGYYLLNWFLHFGYGVIVCGLGVFFIFLSNGKFDDVASWLYSSRNFLLLVIKSLAFFTTYKVVSFYKKGAETFEVKKDKEVMINLLIFFGFAFVLKFFMSKATVFNVNTIPHFLGLSLDFFLFAFLRKYYREFAWYDLLLISFTQTVVYFMIYQESFYLSLIGIGFFYFLYQHLNKWNNPLMIMSSTLCGVFIFTESTIPKQEMFFYYFSLFSGYALYLFLARLVGQFTKLKAKS